MFAQGAPLVMSVMCYHFPLLAYLSSQAVFSLLAMAYTNLDEDLFFGESSPSLFSPLVYSDKCPFFIKPFMASSN